MSPTSAREVSLSRHGGGKPRPGPSDREIAWLATRQYGVVSRAQLRDLGLGEDAIDTRLHRGRLIRLYRGVYAVGHELLPREGHWLAAVLRGGEAAVLSHGSAAALWGVLRTRGTARIDISLPRSTQLPMPIRRHKVRLGPDDVTTRRRIPVTTLTRTLFDLAAQSSEESLEGAIREAEYLHRFQPERLGQMMERQPGRRGARTVRACLHNIDCGPAGRTRSRLEVRFAALLSRTDLPMPTLNALLDLDGFKVEADCLWRDQRVIVELDGAEAHGTRAAFVSDRERDRRLQVMGWRVIRVTWHQLDDPAALLADLRHLLAKSPPPAV